VPGVEVYDVIVAGFGFAGGISALSAARCGAKTLLVEKSSVPGGLSICSYGGGRSARDPEAAFLYLKATNDDRTPDDVLRVLADGMCDMERYFRELGKINHAKITTSLIQSASIKERSNSKQERQGWGNYPFPGIETFYYTSVEDVPDFDARTAYPWANGAPDGPKLFKVVHDNLLDSGVEIRLGTPVLGLISDPHSREVRGVRVSSAGVESQILARRAVVLATGGFEGNIEMQNQFLEGKPILHAAGGTNTGDGIRMAQHLGAALWHMWHIHGAYGFRHVDPNYGYAIRLKRFPDWIPGDAGSVELKMPWILVDQNGHRFMSEYQPYTQDTAIRPMQHFDPETQRFPRNPAFMICDDAGRRLYPLGRPTSNDEGVRFMWSDDNLREVELGILKRASSISGLASVLGIDVAALEESVARWNTMCKRGTRDEDFGRPSGSMMPIEAPPFFGAPVWATISNTQGGPVHDAMQRVIDVYGNPIPRLYAAGELGSSFGHLYLSGGNIAECITTGRIAGDNAAKTEPTLLER
jgi:succinate dehydrogenase/fumarate reductase flavoprotein subunit